MPHTLKLLAVAALFPAVAALSQAAKPSGPAPTAPTIQTRAQLVVVDVVVTGRNGQPVRGLKPEDFTILEDNAPQALRGFEAHAAPPTNTAFTAAPPLPPDIFTNYAPLSSGDAVNVLLLDELNTPMKDQSYVRDQLLEYVKKAPAGTPIAIFALNDRLLLLQGVTSNPELLKSVIERQALAASRYLPDAAAGVDSNPDSAYNMLTSMTGTDGPDIATLLVNVQQMEAVEQSVQIQQRTQMTLDAMNTLAHYLGGIPGRKNLIWFSGSFPLSILPDPALKRPFDVVADSGDEFRETARLLAYSEVAVYPVDARGIASAPSTNASLSGEKVGSGAVFARGQTKFFEKTDDEQGTMLQMAEATGGHAFVNTNGLTDAVAAAIEDGANYYTLAYTPSDPRLDGKYRKIEIKVRQPGVTLEYRRGYYSDDAKTAAAGFSSVAPPAKTMQLAMLRGGPDPTQIVFKSRIMPSPLAIEDKPAPGNRVNSRPKEAKGPYRRYLIDVAASPGDVSFLPQPGGKYKGDLQMMVVVYDQGGVVINQMGEEMHTNLPLDTYRKLFAHGIQFHAEISVPVKASEKDPVKDMGKDPNKNPAQNPSNSHYYLRIGLHDLNADRVGALEVPVSSIRELAAAPSREPAKSPAK